MECECIICNENSQDIKETIKFLCVYKSQYSTGKYLLNTCPQKSLKILEKTNKREIGKTPKKLIV